jgi:hypothetical protein
MKSLDQMAPHQQRVREEWEDLDGRVVKLKAFIESPKFGSVDPEERSRLNAQLRCMEKLADILMERLEHF